MDPNTFQAGFPGELVPTVGWEEYPDNRGRTQTRQSSGVAYVPDNLPPTLALDQILDVYGAAEHALGELNGLADDRTFSSLLAAPLLRNEARVSSKIENTIATAEEVMSYEAGRTEVRQDTIEVSNYRTALIHGIRSELPICQRLVCEMHSILLQNTRGNDRSPGAFRTDQNRIGGSRDNFLSATFVPPPPGDPLDKCFRSLEKFWNTTSKKTPLLVSIVLAHYQFETIHPFNDGNGRLGRAIAMLSLCKGGSLKEPLLYLSGYFSKHRDRYYELLLKVSTHGVWEEWCRFFLQGIAEQATISIRKIHTIRDARQSIRQTIVEHNAPSKINRLVDILIELPAIDASSINRVSQNLEVSPQTLRNYIQRLVDMKFLEESTGNKYDRIWLVPEILAVINSDD